MQTVEANGGLSLDQYGRCKELSTAGQALNKNLIFKILLQYCKTTLMMQLICNHVMIYLYTPLN